MYYFIKNRNPSIWIITFLATVATVATISTLAICSPLFAKNNTDIVSSEKAVLELRTYACSNISRIRLGREWKLLF